MNMAVSKLWSINEGGLIRVLQYAANPKKTNNKLYVSGINCEPETAYEEFTAVKRSYASAPMQKQTALKPITVISALRNRTSHRS